MSGALPALRREDGMSLVEVLIVSILMLIVLGATLTTFNSFERNARDNQDLNEAQDQSRRALDLLARDLRNLASPTPLLPLAVDKMDAQDLIFQSEGKVKDPDSLNAQNTVRVRYCLDTASKTLVRQIQTWKTIDPPAIPVTECGKGAEWASTLAVARDVSNGDRPIFTYNAPAGQFDKVTEVTAQLWVDTTPNRVPSEVDLQTSVYLRNQNRAPTAMFSWVSLPGGAIFLNASASTDPEERALTFEWYNADFTPDKLIGDGIVFTYPAPSPGIHHIYLKVKDATLETDSDTKPVCATGPGVTCP